MELHFKESIKPHYIMLPWLWVINRTAFHTPHRHNLINAACLLHAIITDLYAGRAYETSFPRIYIYIDPISKCSYHHFVRITRWRDNE